ncbi:hypothetical protein PgNI_06642, partial [Pyricularia grisea]|uniref:Uncharacterized protein n=1 Tax=Pyricularia grisea TaxID=148305 RepID=A0A6P8B667_PYRGI
NAPQRFKFTLKNDLNFNYEIVVNVIYLEFKPIFHIINANIIFQIARFLNNIIARKLWEIFKKCWINIYLKPPDIIIYN